MDKCKSYYMDLYYESVVNNSELARGYIEKLNYSNDPYFLNCIELTYRDQSIFKKNGDARKNLTKRYLNLAKDFNDKAYKLNPSCIEILFIRGTIYNLLYEFQEAIDCFIKIFETENIHNKKVNCGNDSKDVLMMIQNDAYFHLYRLFLKINSSKIANKFLKVYKEGLKKGISTIYMPIENFM